MIGSPSGDHYLILLGFLCRSKESGRVKGDSEGTGCVYTLSLLGSNLGHLGGHREVDGDRFFGRLILDWPAVTCGSRAGEHAVFPLVVEVRGGAAEVAEEATKGIQQSDVIIIEKDLAAHSLVERPMVVALFGYDGVVFFEMASAPIGPPERGILEERQCPIVVVVTRIVTQKGNDIIEGQFPIR